MGDDRISSTLSNEITDAVQRLMAHTVSELKANAVTQPAGESRLFFPNGIELISIVVKVGPADVELTIAGEKGAKPAGPAREPLAVHHRDVTATSDSEVIHNKEQIIWFNNGGHDFQIDFDINGCPLDKCSFKVSKNGGIYVTAVTTNVANDYEYHHTEMTKDGGKACILANPKIIIR